MSVELSVVVVVKNEEKNLPACLAAVSWADEILVVDTGSTDSTMVVATQMGTRVEQLAWQGYGPTKATAITMAKFDWVLALDADEVVSPVLKTQIQKTLVNPTAAGYRIKRNSFYLGRQIKHCGWDKDYPLRLFNRKLGNFNQSQVHEKVTLPGKVEKLSGPLWHYTYPSLHSHLLKLDEYPALQAAQLAARGKRATVAGAITSGIWRFLYTYTFKLGFLDGLPGLILCLNSGFGVYIKYLSLWEINGKNRNPWVIGRIES
jgi:glycosyltransferase involved in cell wall biosynthesis